MHADKVTLASQSSFSASAGQRRRRSSAARQLPPNNINLPDSAESRSRLGTTSGLHGRSLGEALPSIPGTPGAFEMSRSPSPQPGGWSSPGLNAPDYNGGRTSPYANGSSSHNVTWASAQARSAEVKGYPAFTPRNQGFFGKHFRRISTSLPFNHGDKEKLGRGRPQNKVMRFLNAIAWTVWRLRKRVALVLFVVFFFIFYNSNTRKLLCSLTPRMATGIDDCSLTSHVQTVRMVRRRQQICRHTRSEPRWRCYGMEGPPRVGHRT